MTYPTSPPLEPVAEPPRAEPGWYRDPWGVAPARWWDGDAWTAHVVHAQPPRWWGGPPPTLRPGAGWSMVAAVVALWVLIRTTSEPVADAIGPTATIAAGYAVLFGGMGLVAWWVSGVFGTGDRRRDLGLEARALDLLLLPVGAVSLLILEGIVGTLVRAGDVPMRSNGESVAQLRDHPGTFAVLVVAAVVAAPIFEEICFRGVIQRSLASKVPAAVAVLGSSVLFGLYHSTPEFGVGNLGQAIVLGVLGLALGTLAHLTGRLAPSMLAHAGLNALILSILWWVAAEFV